LSLSRARVFVALLVLGSRAAFAGPPLKPPCDSDTAPCASVNGEIAWIFSDSLDLVGTMSADLSWRQSFYLSLDARTAIERSISGLTFAVQSMDYRLETGARFPVGASIFAGQRGRENVDAPGEPYVRYVGAGWS